MCLEDHELGLLAGLAAYPGEVDQVVSFIELIWSSVADRRLEVCEVSESWTSVDIGL